MKQPLQQKKLLQTVLKLAVIALSIVVTTSQSCPNLVFSDEFDGRTLDITKWSYQNGNGCAEGICGWGNNELQSYQPENAFLLDGKLIIEARFDEQTKKYTSAKIISKNKADFGPIGRFEARIKVPSGGQGIWPAFWMLPTDEVYGGWPLSGEIDIMEAIGKEPYTLHGSLHYGDLWPNNLYQGKSVSLHNKLSDEYHIFAIEREENSIRWLLDDVVYSTKTNHDIYPYNWPFNEEFFFILNVAVGGSWPGNPNKSTILPTRMEVDYIRTWEGILPKLTGRRKVNHEQKSVTYSIEESLPSSSYIWRVPQDATIVSGQGTSSINVNFGASSGLLTVVVSSQECSFTRNYEMYVVVRQNTNVVSSFFDFYGIEEETSIVQESSTGSTLSFMNAEGDGEEDPEKGKESTTRFSFLNFDGINQANFESSSGEFRIFSFNPNQDSDINQSLLVGRYQRDGGNRWDQLSFRTSAMTSINVSQLIRSDKFINLDLYTETAAIRTEIILILEDNTKTSSSEGYPNGRHSRYRAFTSKQNDWERLRFEFIDQPDPTVQDGSITNIVIQFAYGTFTSDLYYIDNLDLFSVKKPVFEIIYNDDKITLVTSGSSNYNSAASTTTATSSNQNSATIFSNSNNDHDSAKCSAHSNCSHLANDCCPTRSGMYLDCCSIV